MRKNLLASGCAVPKIGSAVMAMLISAMLSCASQVHARAVEKSGLQACPFSPAELRSTLGIELRPGRGNEQPYPEGRLLGCSYSGVSGGPSLFVSQTWIPERILVETQKSMDRYAGGQFTSIKRDPDGARWLSDSEQKNQIALIYARGNVRTEIRLVGARPLAVDAQVRLLKLRRVP